MNVFVGRNFVCHLDNSKWCEENGHTPWIDIGFEHINDYDSYMKEQSNGKAKVYGRHSNQRVMAGNSR